MAEQLVLAANSPALATVSLRPHLIWGPGDNHLVPRIVARARAGKLRRIGNRPCLVDTVYVDNAAHAHLLAADRLVPGGAVAGKAYFISNGEPLPLWEMVNRILAAAGLPPVTRSISRRRRLYAAGAFCEVIWSVLRLPGEPPMTRFVARELATAHWFDISAARRDLGYVPGISIDEGLKTTDGVACRRKSMNRPTIPAAGEVHIWFTPLDRQSAELARLERFLSADERARADRLLERRTRDRFVAGRGFLRETLADYLGVKPEDLRFAQGEHGKPALLDETGSAPLRSTSPIRMTGPSWPLPAPARWGSTWNGCGTICRSGRWRSGSIPPGNGRNCSAFLPDLQPAAFFRCWTRKEAYLKGCGRGFTQPADSFDMSLLPGHPPELLTHRTAPAEASRWRDSRYPRTRRLLRGPCRRMRIDHLFPTPPRR